MFECDPTWFSATTDMIMQSYNIIPHLIVSALTCPGFIDVILADITDMWQKCQANHTNTRLPKLCIISIWNEWWFFLLLWHFVFAKSNCIIISYVQETEGNIQCYFPYFLLSIRPSKQHIGLFCYVQLPTTDPLMNSQNLCKHTPSLGKQTWGKNNKL